jgi:hypothetical protein
MDGLNKLLTGLLIAFLYFSIFIGPIYWLWMAIQLGSFFMFFLGLFPLAWPLTVTVGAWSFLFGMPEWVASWFG